jgi:predicted Zn-dependent protease
MCERKGRAVALPFFLMVSLTAGIASAEPFVPSDDATVLERLRDPADRTEAELRSLADRLRRTSDDRTLALQLARRYVETGRATGDPRYSGYAEAALAPWLGAEPIDPDVQLMRAVLRQNRHAFADALSDLDAVLRRRPKDVQALLTRATVLQVQGRPKEAARDCAALEGRVYPLVAAVCAADLAALTGRAEMAERFLGLVLSQGGVEDPALRAWALTARAEIAGLRGDTVAAEASFREALALDRSDIYLRAAYADLLLDLGRPADVRALIGDETRPDALLLRLVLAAKAAGDPDAPDLAAKLGDRFAAAKLRGDATHRREEARFRLVATGDIGAALALARDNWTVQRERWDARLLLEAAVAAGDASAAAPVIDWMKATGIEDPRLAALVAQLSGKAS